MTDNSAASFRPKVLCITPVDHIKDLRGRMERTCQVRVHPDPVLADLKPDLPWAEAVFTNPNKSRVYLGARFMDLAASLKLIATASTGLIHIDLDQARERDIKVVSLTRELPTLERISSTAEHALTLTMAALRHLPAACGHVLQGGWNYEPFIGRQVNQLTVGVLGYGRLGKMYCRYLRALGAEVIVCDPAYDASSCPYPMTDIGGLFRRSDVVSLHIHATKGNLSLIGRSLLEQAGPDMVIVNTSRGEIINEPDMVDYLRGNPGATYATDVIAGEVGESVDSPILAYAKQGGGVIITPHIGGMTVEAQQIAYHRAWDLLLEALEIVE